MYRSGNLLSCHFSEKFKFTWVLQHKKINHLKQMGLIRDYVKEFFFLMLEAPSMDEKDFLFNFMENL